MTATQQFIQEHLHENTDRLLLNASHYPAIDVPAAVDQILIRRQIKTKLPSWYANEEVCFPARITGEQCSSERTALYKQRLVHDTDTVCDLTGGLGVDTLAFAQVAKKVIYIERYESYCEIARHNFKVWGANTVEVMQGESMNCLDRLPAVEVFYVDPARRGDQAQRVYALADCEPNLPPNLPGLMAKASFLIAKLSPMIDITRSLALLPHTKEVHILSVKNECKEVLFVVGHAEVVPQIICVNLQSNDVEEGFVFEWGDEQKAVITPTSEVGAYLFEPNASVLKAGAFKSVASRFDCLPLHVSSHLYTANEVRKDFPGRHFKVQAVIPFKGKNRKQLGRDFPKANITIRNFPLSVAELRRKTKIKEGGEDYLFATTLANEEKVIIHALKC